MKETKQTRDGNRPDAIIDLERLKTNCHGNPDIVSELVSHLLEKSQPKWTASLEKGIEAKDSVYLRETCHAMKGAAATVFAWRLSNLAADLGSYARDENFAACARQLQTIRDAFTELDQWKAENL